MILYLNEREEDDLSVGIAHKNFPGQTSPRFKTRSLDRGRGIGSRQSAVDSPPVAVHAHQYPAPPVSSVLPVLSFQTDGNQYNSLPWCTSNHAIPLLSSRSSARFARSSVQPVVFRTSSISTVPRGREDKDLSKSWFCSIFGS